MGESGQQEYDEFGLFEGNARDAGLAYPGPPTVERAALTLADGQTVSALVWGAAPPELVLVHGGAQNAHTWDTVAMALERPLVAIDLPGHGHSGWREDRDYWPVSSARALAPTIGELAPHARAVVGMSLGGLTAIRIAAEHPELVAKLILVDVTPEVDDTKAGPIAAFVDGPETFPSFDELLERTMLYNPTRSESSLRRGILHNARPLPDGGWAWRYDRLRPPHDGLQFGALWDDLAKVTAPIMLVLGADSGVVAAEDVERFRQLQPGARIETVAGSGHSVQGDQPLELARLIVDFTGL